MSLTLSTLRLFQFSVAFFLIGCVTVCPVLKAQEVYFGGVGFISWDDREQLFPQTSKMLCRAKKCSHGNIDTLARPFFQNMSYNNFKLGTKVGTEQAEGIIMAPMISRESVGIVKDETGYIHEYRLFASVMFFKFGTDNRFIASRPVLYRILDVLDHKATEEEQFAMFASMLGYGEKRKNNLFQLLAAASKDVDPSVIAEKYAQVKINNLDDTVKNIISKDYDEASWKVQVAQIFESFLIKETRAPLIPSISETQVTDNLQGTFQEASYEIKLPEPWFKIGVDVNLFKAFEKVKGPSKNYCPAVKIALNIGSELESLLKSSFTRTRRSCTVVAASKYMPPLFFFQGSLYSLLSRLSKQFGDNPADRFLEDSNPDSKSIEDQIKAVKDQVFKTGL